VVKLDRNGNKVWRDTKEVSTYTFNAVDLDVDAAGNAHASGDSAVMAYAPDGTHHWILESEDPDSWADSIGDLALDAAGTVSLAGTAEVEGSLDFAVSRPAPR